MKQPFISFCIATYQRPKFLKSTIESILKQKYKNIEIVISEDPSEETSEKVVKSFKSDKIIYHRNKNHLGMTKSYNKAISLSKGDFIVLLADDDPPTDDMLETFLKAFKKYPNKKAFWGASYAKITTSEIEKITNLKKGLNSLVNKNMKYADTEVLEPKVFFKKFFRQEIFPHYQWTTAIIAKDLIEKTDGIPDYDSAHFIDYAYLLKIAKKTEFVIINKELGSFALHKLSYGKRKDTLDEYKRGVIGFDKTISKLAYDFGLRKDYQKFLTNYVIMFLVGRLEFYRIHKIPVDPKSLFKVYNDLCKNLAFFKKRKKEVYIRLNFYYAYRLISQLRGIYGLFKLQIAQRLSSVL